MGAPHADLPQAQGARGRRSRSRSSILVHGRAGLDLRRRRPARPATRSTASAALREIYLLGRSALHRPRHRAGAVGQGAQRTIVNNESSEIIRMLNSAFDAFADARTDYYPAELRGEIDASTTLRLSPTSTTASIAPASRPRRRPTRRRSATLFAALDGLEERLSRQRYLVGARITEADWRLFTTLVRFDAGLLRPLQVQPAPHRRLSEPVELSARPLPGAGRRRDRRTRPHQAALLRQPRHDQSDRHRAARAGARLRRAARSRGSGDVPSARLRWREDPARPGDLRARTLAPRTRWTWITPRRRPAPARSRTRVRTARRSAATPPD